MMAEWRNWLRFWLGWPFVSFAFLVKTALRLRGTLDPRFLQPGRWRRRSLTDVVEEEGP
jgi:hypothetical protein